MRSNFIKFLFFLGSSSPLLALECSSLYTELIALDYSPREAAQRIQARVTATDYVQEKFQQLRANPENDHRTSRELLRSARIQVRNSLGSKKAEKAFDEAIKDVEGLLDEADLRYKSKIPEPGDAKIGQRDFERQLEVFLHPEKYFPQKNSKERTTPFEDYLLSRFALRNLLDKGETSPNAVHIAEHIHALENPAIAKALQKLGISPIRAVRNALLHDLGKEYDQLPADFQNFLEKVFPKPAPGEPDVNYLPRVILSHEFGSMLMTEKIAGEAGIDSRKIPGLKALFARHNAGYNPKLPGSHFWVQPFAWRKFAEGMRKNGIPVPEEYPPVVAVEKDGEAETIILTAIDRGTSLTLASQAKFAATWLRQDKWTNQQMAEELKANAENVMDEVKDVLGQLTSLQQKAMSPAVEKFYRAHREKLIALAKEFPQMAEGRGSYSDRPETTERELSDSIVYRTKHKKWYRVTKDGKVYGKGKEGTWQIDRDLSASPGQTPDPIAILFEKIIYKDRRYQPSTLKDPKVFEDFPY